MYRLRGPSQERLLLLNFEPASEIENDSDNNLQ